jgi:hypothetical protein
MKLVTDNFCAECGFYYKYNCACPNKKPRLNKNWYRRVFSTIFKRCEKSVLGAKFHIDAFILLLVYAIVFIPTLLALFVAYIGLYPIWRPIYFIINKGRS